jgi:hypothetical protein
MQSVDLSYGVVAGHVLDGLPESFIEGLQRMEDGHYRVTLDYPTYFPFEGP